MPRGLQTHCCGDADYLHGQYCCHVLDTEKGQILFASHPRDVQSRRQYHKPANRQKKHSYSPKGLTKELTDASLTAVKNTDFVRNMEQWFKGASLGALDKVESVGKMVVGAAQGAKSVISNSESSNDESEEVVAEITPSPKPSASLALSNLPCLTTIGSLLFALASLLKFLY